MRNNGCLIIVLGLGLIGYIVTDQLAPAWISPAPANVNSSVQDAMLDSEREELRERAENYAKAARMTGDDQEVADYLKKTNAAAREDKRDRYVRLMKWDSAAERREVLNSISKALEAMAGR